MPVGFQSINDSGSYQIDGEKRNPCFLRKGTLTTATYQSGQTTSPSQSRATVAIAANEFIAFSCPSLMSMVGRRDGNAEFMARVPAGTLIDYWIFGFPTTTSSFGGQFYNAAGELVYDTGWKPLNVVGRTSGNGTFTFTAGRTYAVILEQMYLRNQRFTQATTSAPPFPVLLLRNITAGQARISANQVIVAEDSADVWVVGPTTSTPVGWVQDVNNGQTTRYIVVDVTGL